MYLAVCSNLLFKMKKIMFLQTDTKTEKTVIVAIMYLENVII